LNRFYCIILHQMFLTHWYEIIYKLISDLSYLTLYILQFVKYIFLNYFYFNAFDVSDHSERYPLNRCLINDLTIHVLLHENWQFLNMVSVKTIENRIYIREEFNGKKCKTASLLYFLHTAGVLHLFMLYNRLGPGISFYRKSKIIAKRKPKFEIGWFHNWPMIISHRLYAFHFTNDDFPL